MSVGGFFPLVIAQGATFQQSFQLKNGGSEKNPLDGEPINLKGYEGRCHIRNGAQNPGIIMVVPITITNENEGIFEMNLTAEQTASIPATGSIYSETNTYSYDVEIFNKTGYVDRVLNGAVIISPETTK